MPSTAFRTAMVTCSSLLDEIMGSLLPRLVMQYGSEKPTWNN
jgi:hypothetical protein